MDKMNLFGINNKEDDQKYIQMRDLLQAELHLTNEERLVLDLRYLCMEIEEYITLEENNTIEEIIPSIGEFKCGISINIKNKEPLLIHIVNNSMVCRNSLLFSKDFTSRNITNADLIIKLLNIRLPNFNFMLDMDTNEN